MVEPQLTTPGSTDPKSEFGQPKAEPTENQSRYQTVTQQVSLCVYCLFLLYPKFQPLEP
jgi:hypothetical protein